MTPDEKSKWEKQDAEHQRERWASIVQHYVIFSDGHRLVTHGDHTGHVYQTVALCENEHIASALAAALERQRKE